VLRGMKLRLQDDEVPRSALDITTSEGIVNKGSVAGIYGDADYGCGSYCCPAPARFFASASCLSDWYDSAAPRLLQPVRPSSAVAPGPASLPTRCITPMGRGMPRDRVATVTRSST
jgi:hypothetical protein